MNQSRLDQTANMGMIDWKYPVDKSESIRKLATALFVAPVRLFPSAGFLAHSQQRIEVQNVGFSNCELGVLFSGLYHKKGACDQGENE